MIVAGIDVGGTGIKGLLLDDTGAVLTEQRCPTPSPDPDGTRVAEAVAELVRALDPADDVPIGVAVPGIVDEDAGVGVLSVNLGWREVPLVSLLERAIGRPVALTHDIRAGAIAEAAATGAIKGTTAFVAVGTGIAAAVLLDGRPLAAGWAGEIGQQLVAHGPDAGLAVEQVASASAIARRAGAPDALTVARRVRDGDPAACAAWERAVETLADAVTGLIVTAAPSRLVVGGGLALAGDLLFGPLTAAIGRRVPPEMVPVTTAAVLGDLAAARGAAAQAANGVR